MSVALHHQQHKVHDQRMVISPPPPPPSHSRLPPDGHEFPPEYREPPSKNINIQVYYIFKCSKKKRIFCIFVYCFCLSANKILVQRFDNLLISLSLEAFLLFCYLIVRGEERCGLCQCIELHFPNASGKLDL